MSRSVNSSGVTKWWYSHSSTFMKHVCSRKRNFSSPTSYPDRVYTGKLGWMFDHFLTSCHSDGLVPYHLLRGCSRPFFPKKIKVRINVSLSLSLDLTWLFETWDVSRMLRQWLESKWFGELEKDREAGVMNTDFGPNAWVDILVLSLPSHMTLGRILHLLGLSFPISGMKLHNACLRGFFSGWKDAERSPSPGRGSCWRPGKTITFTSILGKTHHLAVCHTQRAYWSVVMACHVVHGRLRFVCGGEVGAWRPPLRWAW